MDRRGGYVQSGGPGRAPRPGPPRSAVAAGPGRPRQGRRQPERPLPALRLTRRARRLLRAFFGGAAALVLIAAGAGWYLHASVLGGLASSHALAGLGSTPRAGSDLNILLMGLDSRRDNQGNDLPPAILAQLHAGSSSDVGGYNANTLILLHVPANGSRAVALSIPRDDYVNLPEGLGAHKIKEAYGRAKANAEALARANGNGDRAALEHLGREAGRHAEIDAVQRLLGVTVDHFAEINLAGFYDLANALGGVTVCLRAPAQDGYSGASFPAGVQTLDGAQSLAFVRQRHGLANGDLDRTHRQQAFLASAVYKLRRAGVFDDVTRIGALLDVARKDVVVDSGLDLISFMHQARAVTSGNVTFYTLPITGYAMQDGESVNLIDPAQVREAAQRLLAGKGLDVVGTSAPPSAAGPAIPQAAAQVEARPSASPSAAEAAPGSLPGASAKAKAKGAGKAAATGLAATLSPAAPTPAAPPSTALTSTAPMITAPPGIPCVD